MFQPTPTCNKVDFGERCPQMIFQKINQSPESRRILQQGADIAAKRGRAVSYLRGPVWLPTELRSPGEAGSRHVLPGAGKGKDGQRGEELAASPPVRAPGSAPSPARPHPRPHRKSTPGTGKSGKDRTRSRTLPSRSSLTSAS